MTRWPPNKYRPPPRDTKVDEDAWENMLKCYLNRPSEFYKMVSQFKVIKSMRRKYGVNDGPPK